ncbi:MAG: imidazolonepropionase [Chloroflexota bacterium]|nr:imidazolonepropionase [Chloroflexota bacterium]
MSPGGRLLIGSGRLLVAQPDGAPQPGALSPWALLIRDGLIAWLGSPDDAPAVGEVDDLGSALVTPGLIDAHTHPVFAGDRSDEAAARLAGAPYSGGGIMRTVAATRAASDSELLDLTAGRLAAALGSGTTTIECKSGYGLAPAEELRQLAIIGRAAQRVGMRVVRTFLGAHAVGPEVASPAEYVASVIDDMLPEAARHAEFCDVFCDEGFFDLQSTEAILTTARSLGLGLRLHAEQLARTGATELGVRLGAASVDHLERLDAAGVAALAHSRTVATLLPGPALAMGGGPLPPARELLAAGVRVALATDANAGTWGSWSMPMAIGLGATLLGMGVDAAVRSATFGAAQALQLDEVCGTLRAGLAADIVAWDAEHEGAFALRMGDVRPARVWMAGIEASR